MRMTGALVAIVVFIAFSIAWSIGAKEIIEKVQAKYDDIDDAVVAFTQKVRFKVSKAEQLASGTLYFRKKNMYRIETDQRTIVTDGKTSWSFNPKTKQVLISVFKEDSRSLSPENLLLHYPDNYYSSLVGEEKLAGESCYALKLTPKENNALAKTMKVWVTQKWMIRKIEVTDANGTVTTWIAKDIVINKGIPDSRFEFKTPPGADVIDLR